MTDNHRIGPGGHIGQTLTFTYRDPVAGFMGAAL